MYSQEAISFLEARIGFGALNVSGVSVDAEHQTGTSGRSLTYFHKLASLHNIYYTVEKAGMTSAELNAHLAQLKKDSVRAILTAILNKNKLYRDDVDYSGTILSKPELFDDAIGYSLAIAVIEQMASSTRSNKEGNEAKLSYQQLKIELEGIIDDNGRIRAKGLNLELFSSIKAASSVLFRDPLTVESGNFW
ncbi:MAG: hypothetical protein WBL21_06055 [Salinimicrobium sp.]